VAHFVLDGQGVPAQRPAPSHTSPEVQPLPSSHCVPLPAKLWTQEVPLHANDEQAELAGHGAQTPDEPHIASVLPAWQVPPVPEEQHPPLQL
jgi:hypothetical protein